MAIIDSQQDSKASEKNFKSSSSVVTLQSEPVKLSAGLSPATFFGSTVVSSKSHAKDKKFVHSLALEAGMDKVPFVHDNISAQAQPVMTGAASANAVTVNEALKNINQDDITAEKFQGLKRLAYLDLALTANKDNQEQFTTQHIVEQAKPVEAVAEKASMTTVLAALKAEAQRHKRHGTLFAAAAKQHEKSELFAGKQRLENLSHSSALSDSLDLVGMSDSARARLAKIDNAPTVTRTLSH